MFYMPSSSVKDSVSRPSKVVYAASPWKFIGQRRICSGAYDCGRAEFNTVSVYEREVIKVRSYLDDLYPPWEELSKKVERKEE